MTVARETQARLIAAAPRVYDTRPKAIYSRRTQRRRASYARAGQYDDGDGGYASADAAGPVGRNEGGPGGRGQGSASPSRPSNPYLAATANSSTGGDGGGLRRGIGVWCGRQ